jgi:hypothetical protein
MRPVLGDSACGCQPRRSGSMRPEPAPPGAATAISIKLPGTAATADTRRTRWEGSNRTHGDCPTCWGTSGVGGGLVRSIPDRQCDRSARPGDRDRSSAAGRCLGRQSRERARVGPSRGRTGGPRQRRRFPVWGELVSLCSFFFFLFSLGGAAHLQAACGAGCQPAADCQSACCLP